MVHMSDPFKPESKSPDASNPARELALASRATPLFWRSKSLFHWLFRNRKTGKITIAQLPNAALWIFFATTALRWVVPTDTASHTVIDWMGVAALAWWALDEVLRGVNPWRRMLGLGGCAFVVAGASSLLH
jgi:hypothetical protein